MVSFPLINGPFFSGSLRNHLDSFVHNLDLVLVGQDMKRLLAVRPTHLVELTVVVAEGASHGTHEVEVHRFVAPDPVIGTYKPVLDGVDGRLQYHLQSRLLRHLPYGRLLQGFSWVG